MLKLILNKKYNPLFESDARYFIITGGRGSGMSFAVSVFLTLITMSSNIRILFTRFTMVSAQLSIIPEFLEKISLLGFDNLFAVNKAKSKEVQKLEKVIDNNKKEEKKVEKHIKELEVSKKASKKEIGSLKRKLTISKKKTKKMEKAFDEDNADEAVEFLRKFAKK